MLLHRQIQKLKPLIKVFEFQYLWFMQLPPFFKMPFKCHHLISRYPLFFWLLFPSFAWRIQVFNFGLLFRYLSHRLFFSNLDQTILIHHYFHLLFITYSLYQVLHLLLFSFSFSIIYVFQHLKHQVWFSYQPLFFYPDILFLLFPFFHLLKPLMKQKIHLFVQLRLNMLLMYQLYNLPLLSHIQMDLGYQTHLHRWMMLYDGSYFYARTRKHLIMLSFL